MSQRTVDGGERYPCAVGFRGIVWGSPKENGKKQKGIEKTAEKSEKQVSPLFFENQTIWLTLKISWNALRELEMWVSMALRSPSGSAARAASRIA